jgi:hypothetical protein
MAVLDEAELQERCTRSGADEPIRLRAAVAVIGGPVEPYVLKARVARLSRGGTELQPEIDHSSTAPEPGAADTQADPGLRLHQLVEDLGGVFLPILRGVVQAGARADRRRAHRSGAEPVPRRTHRREGRRRSRLRGQPAHTRPRWNLRGYPARRVHTAGERQCRGRPPVLEDRGGRQPVRREQPCLALLP